MIYHSQKIDKVTVDGKSLDVEKFVAVARYGAKVDLSPKAREAMEASRKMAEEIVDRQDVVYGITTGFGEFQKIAVPVEKSEQLSTNLILSHCTSTGDPFPDEVVRGMLLLRANALAVGLSGVRPILVDMMLEMLNKGVVPIVPEKGSVGSSGDLAPLANMTLPMIGLGRAKFQGKEMAGKEAMEAAGIKPLDGLSYKEGLGMTNGTCAMTSVGALAFYDTVKCGQLADIISSMSMEGLTVLRNAFDERIQLARPHKGQITVAKNLRELTEGSEILDNCQHDRVQDAYSLRCIPQIHGGCRDALDYVSRMLEVELNSVTDNPLLFLDNGDVISGGNFHGEPMGLAFDTLGIAAAELADVSERRIERMVNDALSNGLTPFLTTEPGINSGFMIVQYAAASMVSENKIYAHPASVDSIPTSANQEDLVSMATTAARTAAMIVDNTYNVLADELMVACQAIDIRRRLDTHGQGITDFHQALHDRVREDVDFYEIDREIAPDIRKVEALVRSDEILEMVEEYIPDFE